MAAAAAAAAPPAQNGVESVIQRLAAETWAVGPNLSNIRRTQEVVDKHGCVQKLLSLSCTLHELVLLLLRDFLRTYAAATSLLTVVHCWACCSPTHSSPYQTGGGFSWSRTTSATWSACCGTRPSAPPPPSPRCTAQQCTHRAARTAGPATSAGMWNVGMCLCAGGVGTRT